MSKKFTSGANWNTAQAVSNPVFSCPLPGVQVALLLTQQFMQSHISWAPLALNTAHPDSSYDDFILVEESPLEDMGGDVVKWTRTYAKIPDSYTEPGGNYNYSFIGFFGQWGLNVTIITGRDRFVRPSPVIITRDFFLTDPTGSSGGAGTLASPLDSFIHIPVNNEYRYYYGSAPTVNIDAIAFVGELAEDTVPTREAYLALVTAGTPINVEKSKVSRWHGLIYMRETLAVIPQ